MLMVIYWIISGSVVIFILSIWLVNVLLSYFPVSICNFIHLEGIKMQAICLLTYLLKFFNKIPYKRLLTPSFVKRLLTPSLLWIFVVCNIVTKNCVHMAVANLLYITNCITFICNLGNTRKVRFQVVYCFLTKGGGIWSTWWDFFLKMLKEI